MWVKSSLTLALDNEDDNSYYTKGLGGVFVNLLSTNPMTEIAIEEAKKMKLEIEKRKPKKYDFEFL